MHLGRFNYVVWNMRNHYREHPLLKSLETVISALQAYQGSPNSETSNAFKESLSKFEELADINPREFSNASYQQVLEDIKGREFLGPMLLETVRALVTEHSLTPVDLQDKLQAFRKRLAVFIGHVTNIANSLDELEAEYTQLEGGEFEVGIHLPRDVVGNSLATLSREIVHIDRLFCAINELMGRQNESVDIRTLSTTWYQFFLQLDIAQIAAFTFAIERIVALYKNNLEIRKLKREAEQHKGMEDVSKLLEQKIEEKLRLGIADVATDLRKEFQKNENESRVNEVEIQIKMELFHLAKRLNEGAEYEVRAGLPREPEAVKEVEGDDGGNKAKLEAHEAEMKLFNDQLKIAQEINDKGRKLSAELQTLDEQPLLTDYEKLAVAKDLKST